MAWEVGIGSEAVVAPAFTRATYGREAPLSRANGRARVCGFAGSVAFHVVVAAAALLTATRVPPVMAAAAAADGGDGGGAGDAGTITVSLVGPLADAAGETSSPMAEPLTARDTDRLDALYQQLTRNQPRPAGGRRDPLPRTDLDQLYKQIAQSHGPAADAGAGQGEDDNGLWAQIRKCWRPATSVSVVLDMAIDSQGRVAGPPRAVRPTTAPADPARLLAESNAVEAIIRCAPFPTAAPAVGVKGFRFEFRRPVSGRT